MYIPDCKISFASYGRLTRTEAEHLVMHEFFSLWFTLHNIWGKFSLAQISAVGFPNLRHHLSCGLLPFLLVRHAKDTLTIRYSPGNEGMRNELQSAKISLHSVKEATNEQSTY